MLRSPSALRATRRASREDLCRRRRRLAPGATARRPSWSSAVPGVLWVFAIGRESGRPKERVPITPFPIVGIANSTRHGVVQPAEWEASLQGLTMSPPEIYLWYRPGRMTMRTAKLFRNGRSQAVRLPMEFRFDGEEVLVKRVGSAVVLLPMSSTWDVLLDSLALFSEDFMDGRVQPEVEHREGLGDAPDA
jgi:antitoxin VapB